MALVAPVPFLPIHALDNDDHDLDNSPFSNFHPNFPPTPSTDITLRTSDGMLFHLHRKNLESHSEVLFPSGCSNVVVVEPNEVTDLTEDSEVLGVVLEFVYPRKQPDVEKMEFEMVIRVAEAVEKYQIFSGMKVCEVGLRKFVSTHATEILVHGIKHDKPVLIEEALPYLARLPLVEVLEKIPCVYHLSWCRYHEAWSKVFKDVIKETLDFYGPRIQMNYLTSAIHSILEWEAIKDYTELKTTLEETAKEECARCGHNNYTLKGCLKKAADGCLEKIKAIPRFSILNGPGGTV